ncbi:MAG: DUF4126 family protein [Puniceicoccaceae bacterium]
MDISSLIYMTGASGFFTSRAFIPAFLTSVFLRYGHHFPWLGNVEFIQATGSEPTWFTSNFTILFLGALSLLEVGATKIPEAQEALDQLHKYTKTGLAAITALGVLNTRDLSFIEQTISQAGVFDMIYSAFFGGLVFFFNTLRSGFMELLIIADPDDDLSFRTLISWFEDIWATVGIWFLFLYPLAMVILVGIVLGFLFLMRKVAEYREARSKRDCPTCDNLVFACAQTCPNCHTEQTDLKDVGFFGQTVDRPARELHQHELRLISKRRCPKCATRVTERKLPQSCPACRNTILGKPDDQAAYIARVRNRLPKVLGVTFALSLIPVIGLIPGIIYYRIQLVGPFRAYIPAGRGFVLRWMVKLIFLLLIALQLVPGLGGFMVPIMALLSYSIYSGYFSSMLAD